MSSDTMAPTEPTLVRPPFAILGNTNLFCVAGTVAAFALAAAYGVPRSIVLLELALVFATGLGITVGFHRYFTHQAFKTYPPVAWVLGILGCMAGQRSVFWWAANHRAHHRYSDQDGDPHSPYWRGGRPVSAPLRGLWHAYTGWLFETQYSYDPRHVADLMKIPGLQTVERLWFAWYLLGLAIPTAHGYWVAGWWGALLGFLWGGMARQFTTNQGAFLVNSIGHVWGSQPYRTGDKSRNNWILGLIALGDGWHNNHHAAPRSARHGFTWWQFDLGWYVICAMRLVGLAWAVQLPKQHLLARRAVVPELEFSDPANGSRFENALESADQDEGSTPGATPVGERLDL